MITQDRFAVVTYIHSIAERDYAAGTLNQEQRGTSSEGDFALLSGHLVKFVIYLELPRIVPFNETNQGKRSPEQVSRAWIAPGQMKQRPGTI